MDASRVGAVLDVGLKLILKRDVPSLAFSDSFIPSEIWQGLSPCFGKKLQALMQLQWQCFCANWALHNRLGD
jgi:hypothetical protein